MEFKSVIAVIPAAGVGSRMKADHPKQYLSIAGDSTPTVLQACIASLSAVSQINRIVVGVSPADGYAADLDLGKAELFRTGGATRSETVLNTLKAIGTETLKDALVLVHDAARPLVDPDDVTELIDKAKTDILKHGPLAGAVLAVPVSDTVKRTDAADVITEDISREHLWRIATPQAFAGLALLNALEKHPDVTDESSAVRAAGGRVSVVAAQPSVFKITRPADLTLARMMFENSQKPMLPEIRTGIGYDSHRLVEGRPLILGGVTIPHTKGLDGHSDADVLLHAVTDAVLGAANLGNIGILFPDTDPAYKGADSGVLLKDAFVRVRAAGWELVNLDAVLIAQKPKINPHLTAIRESIARIMSVDVSRISVKPKTNEKLGFEGREEGMSAFVTVLLARI